MKNIHIIPTDKPSRLYIGDNQNFVFGMIQTSIQSRNDYFTNQHIYITSDEYIGLSYYLDGNLVRKGVVDDEDYWEVRKDYKKIILTTDQDLIKDGVQAIDDEFLEWFIKNPSCEEVEINEYPITSDPRGYKTFYEIIIPKEKLKSFSDFSDKFFGSIPKEELKEKIYFDFTGEVNGLPTLSDVIKEKLSPKEKSKKQHLIDIMKSDEDLGLYEETKQETLEEAAINNYKELYEGEPLIQDVPIDAFIEGAKWSAERSYSEEDMKSFADWCRNGLLNTEYSVDRLNGHLEQWKQFKTKVMKQEIIPELVNIPMMVSMDGKNWKRRNVIALSKGIYMTSNGIKTDADTDEEFRSIDYWKFAKTI